MLILSCLSHDAERIGRLSGCARCWACGHVFFLLLSFLCHYLASFDCHQSPQLYLRGSASLELNCEFADLGKGIQNGYSTVATEILVNGRVYGDVVARGPRVAIRVYRINHLISLITNATTLDSTAPIQP